MPDKPLTKRAHAFLIGAARTSSRLALKERPGLTSRGTEPKANWLVTETSKQLMRSAIRNSEPANQKRGLDMSSANANRPLASC
jgi:hypothetical protein